ncbi:hypothetical protein F4780DRAFT_783188 [Xylariomycetidae sp. FL0641]|nr:hypothetical protein F4780DRAFT_783188 [Xylariomycetidae sp. FL0641]
MGEEEFHRYMSEVHAPLTHITASTRHLTQKLIDAQFINEASYDIITQIRFPNIQCFIDFRNDPFYKEKVKADHDVFTDPGKVVMSVGWVEDHIIDGKVVA